MQLNSLDRKCKICRGFEFGSENVKSHPALDFNCFLRVSEVEQTAGEGKSIRALAVNEGGPHERHQKSEAVKPRFIDDPSIKSSRR